MLVSDIQQRDSVIYVFIYILYGLFSLIGYNKINEYNSLCYTVNPGCLSVSYIVVCIFYSQTPNSCLPLFTLVTISLFSMSVNIFLIYNYIIYNKGIIL